MQHAIDHIIFGFLLAIPLIEWKWSWPRFLNKLAGGGANVRWTYYQKLIASEWIPTICLLTYWALQHRAWSALRLAGDTSLRLGLGLGYVLVLIAFLMLQRCALLGRPDRRARILTALRNVEPLIPHTSPERKLFWVVSATAGFCEELFIEDS